MSTEDQKLIVKEDQPVEQKEERQGIADGLNDVLHPTSAHWKILIFEFFGTMIFAHGINASQGSDFLVAASLFAALIISCKHSGGHINPAVSTGFLCLESGSQSYINTGQWFCYIIAQLLGAFVGGYLSVFILGEAGAPWIPKQDMNWIIADILGEFLGTFTFVLVILIMTNDNTTYNKNTIYILLTVAGALFFSRQLTVHSGGCLNPAIALGLEAMMYYYEGDSKYLRRSYVYIIGPICGAVAAGCFFRYYYLVKKIEEDNKPKQDAQQVEAEAEADKQE